MGLDNPENGLPTGQKEKCPPHSTSITVRGGVEVYAPQDRTE